jgi:molybdopterin-guanine dinucleotide biosynthesis protein A
VTGVAFSGAVLTGGASSRMGADKALLRVQGEALVLRACRALAAATEVFTVGGDLDGLGALGLDARPDRHPGEGPLGGILTALGAAANDLVVVLSCDLLAPSDRVVATLVAALVADDRFAVAVPVVDGYRQPLVAAYRRRASVPLGEAFARGERSPLRALATVDVVEVEGVAAAEVQDADRPEDLNRT